jgi:multicomponent Na+:H+ antiporter subunit B
MTRSSILSTAVRYLLPLQLLFAFFVLARGHNEPGGGFIAGLVVAAAFALYAIAEDVNAARDILHFSPRTFIAVGLLMAATSGLPALLNGQALMTGLWSSVQIPVIGKLGTPFMFDIGVFLAVVGVTLLIIFSLMDPDPALEDHTEDA